MEPIVSIDQLPLAGDVVFFRSSASGAQKVAHRFISLVQRILGIEHFEFIHAGILISPFEIAEARVSSGVSSSHIFDQLNGLPSESYTVLRKPSSLPHEAAMNRADRLNAAAYYFYKESYDFRGLARALDTDANVGSSICSVYVKKVLLRSGELNGDLFSAYKDHIYPGELYAVLKKAGYQEVPALAPFKSTINSLHLPDREKWRRHLAEITDLLNAGRSYSEDIVKTFEESGNDEAVLRTLVVLSGHSVLQLLEWIMKRIATHSTFLPQLVKGADNWRDRERHKKSFDRTTKELESLGNSYYRMHAAISDVLTPPDRGRDYEALKRISSHPADNAEREMILDNVSSKGNIFLLLVIQLTLCTNAAEWRKAVHQLIRRAKILQRDINKNWSNAGLDPPDLEQGARLLVRQLQAALKWTIVLMSLNGEEVGKAQCASTLDAYRAYSDEAKKRLTDLDIPLDLIRNAYVLALKS